MGLKKRLEFSCEIIFFLVWLVLMGLVVFSFVWKQSRKEKEAIRVMNEGKEFFYSEYSKPKIPLRLSNSTAVN